MRDYRKDFPLLKNGEWAYLNNAAQTLVPYSVLTEMNRYYCEIGANVHRGVDSLGYTATAGYDAAREKVMKLIGADSKKGAVVFTRGTTSALNLAALSYGERIKQDDEIVVSMAEHHANFVPWQQLALRKKAKLVFAPLNSYGGVSPEGLRSVLTERTKIVALAHMTNVLGAQNDIEALAKEAHKVGAVMVVDGAQGIGHIKTQVDRWDIDFYAFGAHKILGPTGIGALYGKLDLLNSMPPLETGGDMIEIVEPEYTTFLQAPERFEAGTPMIAEAFGWAAAVDYFLDVGYDYMHEKVFYLRKLLIEQLKQVNNVIIYNENNIDSPIVTFNIKGIHSHDVASVLDSHKVCVRAGHHCSQPAHKIMGAQTSVRASLMFYNNEEDIVRLVGALKEAGDFIDVLF